MNIMITKEEHETLQSKGVETYIIGSHLYGTSREDSDIDYLHIYEQYEEEIPWLPNIHQFQYKEEGIDHIYASDIQFFKNLVNGESTINTDVILFSYPMEEESKLLLCRTYKIINAYLGIARRDLNQYKEGYHKLQHAARGLHCSEFLLDNRLPQLNVIKALYKGSLDVSDLLGIYGELKKECNKRLEEGDLQMYYIPKSGNSLLDKLHHSNNTKEFKYA